MAKCVDNASPMKKRPSTAKRFPTTTNETPKTRAPLMDSNALSHRSERSALSQRSERVKKPVADEGTDEALKGWLDSVLVAPIDRADDAPMRRRRVAQQAAQARTRADAVWRKVLSYLLS